MTVRLEQRMDKTSEIAAELEKQGMKVQIIEEKVRRLNFACYLD